LPAYCPTPESATAWDMASSEYIIPEGGDDSSASGSDGGVTEESQMGNNAGIGVFLLTECLDRHIPAD
jgi:hypothetical protein